ncbi:MAG: helix-turn-helix domain-containing protein [Fimbriimonas sp.]
MMDRTKDWLTELQEGFASDNPAYAAAYERQKFVLALIQMRKAQGLTQGEVAKRMGIPQSRIGQIEGKPWTVSLDRISGYAKALGARFELVTQDDELRKVA